MSDSLQDIQDQFQNNVQTGKGFSGLLPVVYANRPIAHQHITWPPLNDSQEVGSENANAQPAGSSLQNGRSESFEATQATPDSTSVEVQRAVVQNGDLPDGNTSPTNRSKRPASECTNDHQPKKKFASAQHSTTPTHEMDVALLFPLCSKLHTRNERCLNLRDCFGRVPTLILYGNSLPAEVDIELALVSEEKKDIYHYSVYQFMHYQENSKKKVFMSKLRRRATVEKLYDGVGIIRLDNIHIHNRRDNILGKPNDKNYPLKCYPSDEEKKTKARGPTIFVDRYGLDKPCLAIRLFSTDPSITMKINATKGDDFILFSNILTPVEDLTQKMLDDHSQMKVKCRESSAFIHPNGQNRFSITFDITLPEEMLDELNSGGKWLEISLLDNEELSYSYFIESTNGYYNSVCLSIQHTTIPLTVAVLEYKLPVSEEGISMESMETVPTDLVSTHQTSVPTRTTNEAIPTTPLKVRLQLVHTKAGPDGDRKIIHLAGMPIWENVINTKMNTAYCDTSNNQSDASNAILSELPVVISSDNCNEQ